MIIIYIDLNTLFREDTVGMNLLTQLWMMKEGRKFVQEVLIPTVTRVYIYDAPLEVSNPFMHEKIYISIQD